MPAIITSSVSRCSRCGAVLQTEDPNGEHYIDPAVLRRKSLNDIVFCDDCYKACHYSKSPNTIHASEDLIKILKDARATDSLVVYFIDIFSFEYSIPTEVADVIEHQNILILAKNHNTKFSQTNKVDKEEYIAHEFRNYRIKVTRDDVMITDFGVEAMKAIKEKIDEKRRRHDVYLIGSEISPLNTFTRKFLADYVNMSTRTVVTRKYKGTDMEVTRIPLDSSTCIYSTVPFAESNSFLSKGDESFRKNLFPHDDFRARRRHLSTGSSIFLGGLCRIDLIEGKSTDIDVYCAEKVDADVQGGHHIEKHFLERIRKKTIRPTLPEIEGLKDFDVFDVKIDQTGMRDIGISGLGWISFKGNNQTFRIYVYRGIGVYGSRAKVNKNADTKK